MGPFIPRRGKVKETPIDHDSHMHFGVLRDGRICCTNCEWESNEGPFDRVMVEWGNHRAEVAAARVWS